MALVRAFGQGDAEAVEAIVNSTDPPRLLAVMTGLAHLLAEGLYGGVLDEALQRWLENGWPPDPPL